MEPPRTRETMYPIAVQRADVPMKNRKIWALERLKHRQASRNTTVGKSLQFRKRKWKSQENYAPRIEPVKVKAWEEEISTPTTKRLSADRRYLGKGKEESLENINLLHKLPNIV